MNGSKKSMKFTVKTYLGQILLIEMITRHI